MPVYYRASTTFLAASPDQANPELLFGQGNLRTQYYGNANDIDRLITLAHSNELVEFLVELVEFWLNLAKSTIKSTKFTKSLEVTKSG